jgi:hypothetical protein
MVTVRKYAAYAFFWIGHAFSRIGDASFWLYQKSMLFSTRLQGKGEGPWDSVETEKE